MVVECGVVVIIEIPDIGQVSTCDASDDQWDDEPDGSPGQCLHGGPSLSHNEQPDAGLQKQDRPDGNHGQAEPHTQSQQAACGEGVPSQGAVE